MNIDKLEISVRAYLCLTKAGITTVSELCTKTEDELLSIRNISKRCICEVKEALKTLDLQLKS